MDKYLDKHLLGAVLTGLAGVLMAAKDDWSVFMTPWGVGALILAIGSVLYSGKMVDLSK